EAGRPELLLIRGGRLEAVEPDGTPWWRSEYRDLTGLIGVSDLNGDGRREILALARRSACAFDALTGAERWALPEGAFGETPPTAIVTARLGALLDPDQLDLYLTDGGCGDNGTGNGLRVHFAPDAPPTLSALIAGPRRNGRCGRWHTFAAPMVIVTDGDGLNAFDPTSGERQRCGQLPDAPPNGPLPHLRIPGAPAWYAFLPDAVVRLADDAEAQIDGCVGVIAPTWRRPLTGPRAEGAFIAELDGDDAPDLVLTVWRPDEARWAIEALAGADGHTLATLEDALALGPIAFDTDAPPAVLAALGEGATPARFQTLQAFAPGAEDFQARWPTPLTEARALLDPGLPAPTDRTPEFAAPVAWPHATGADLMLVRAVDGLDAALQRVDGAGRVIAATPLDGPPGAVRLGCLALGCAAGLPQFLALARFDGRVAVLDPALRPVAAAEDDGPPVFAPTGAAAVAVAFDGTARRPIVLTPGGLLAALDVENAAAPIRWQVTLGRPRRGATGPVIVPRPGRADGVLARDAAAGEAVWALFDAADGARVWRHALDANTHRPFGDVAVAPEDGGAVILRAELLLDPQAPPPADCPLRVDTDLFAPDPACPATAVIARVVTALDAETGACRWQRRLRPANPCGGPGNQTLSADAGAVHLTETNAARRLDPATGDDLALGDLGAFEGGVLRGGGWLHALGDGWLRVGGNGPIEARAADLSPRWAAANPPDLRLQGWIGRDAALTADAIFVSPGPGYPIGRWRAANGEFLGATGLREGAAEAHAPLAPDFADIIALRAADAVTSAGAPGVLATADDGVLYGLDETGALAWTRHHDARPGAPLVTVLGDDTPALLIPLSDGRVVVYGDPGPSGPRAVWDVPCPPVAACDAAVDIDTTEATDRLCATWPPLANAIGYEARALGPGGVVVRDFAPVERPIAELAGVTLVPGARYAVEVRARLPGGPSAPTASDGVEVINDAPPRVAVAALPPAVAVEAGEVLLIVRAEDDDRLAGWRLEARSLDGFGTWRLAAEPLNQRVFERQVRWTLEDRAKRPLPPGDYLVIASVVDRAFHRATADVRVVLCAGDCN
ncbi:MAG: hypothetical protein KC620_08595, partial [Myxococcales bacterium]|nr:hypothetical protein [Myxococcales bacterium]